MQERINKFKPLSKKEVTQLVNANDEMLLAQESKLSSNSQNKPFIRKPISKRNAFVSPNFTKNRAQQNQVAKNPIDQLKSYKFIQADSRSDHNYWEEKDKTGLGAKLTLKKYITSQQTSKQGIFFNSLNPCKASEAYYGDNSHALTQIGEHYKVQTMESDNSQKDLYSKQIIKKSTKQNIVANGLNTKKVTRTQYFANPNTDEVRSTTSRSLKEKQLNFNSLRHSVNNNIEAYVISLEDSIRKLEKSNYTINKKCKWMHEEVEMHLEKEHLMAAEKRGFQLELKAKEKDIENLTQEKTHLLKEIADLKTELSRKQITNSCRSFKDLQTISSLKELCSKPSQTSFGKISKNHQNSQPYIGIMPSSMDKSKKKSFRTYPGVCSPRKFRDYISKSSSIVGDNQSFHDFGQGSVLYEKSDIQSQITGSKISRVSEDLKKERDQLRGTIESMTHEIQFLKEKNQLKENQNIKELQNRIKQQQKQIQEFQSHCNALQTQKSILLIEINKIHQYHQTEIQAFSLKIKDLQNQISLHSKSQCPSLDFNLQEENPLKYFLENSRTNINYGQITETQNLDHENRSLRIYIQKIIEHYKYMKIQNRMLLKVKEDKEKLEKEKKQIKQERDSFKKKLLQLLKTNKNPGKQPTKSCRRLMDFGSDSSEEEDSAVFQLSQSQIRPNETENRGGKIENQENFESGKSPQKQRQLTMEESHSKYLMFR